MMVPVQIVVPSPTQAVSKPKFESTWVFFPQQAANLIEAVSQSGTCSCIRFGKAGVNEQIPFKLSQAFL